MRVRVRVCVCVRARARALTEAAGMGGNIINSFIARIVIHQRN